MTFTSQKGGSILGELRVTKFILDELLDVMQAGYSLNGRLVRAEDPA